MKIKAISIAISVIALSAAPAMAQEWYAGGSIGLNNQAESDNAGTTGAFTTGNIGDGTTIDVASGTPYGWNTEFDSGMAVSGEFGARYSSGLRSGVEITYSKADVDTHTGVSLGGGSIDALDAASVAGSPTPLSASVADVVADGRGDIKSTGIFANAYYDFNREAPLQPYLGAGIGYQKIDVTYNPSGVGIIDDSESKFAYQVKAGATYQFASQMEMYGEATYRASDDIELNNDLFPGTLNIENKQTILSVGLRYRFG